MYGGWVIIMFNMKNQKKKKSENINETFGIRLTLDKSLDKYKGTEFASEKLAKAEKKFSKQGVKKMPDIEFTVDESLNKYKGPEYTPPKLKEIEKMFSKQVVHH
jgi:hypothetical protein